MAKETLPIRVLWVWRGAAVLTAVVFTLLTVLIFRPTSVVRPILLLIIWGLCAFAAAVYLPAY